MAGGTMSRVEYRIGHRTYRVLTLCVTCGRAIGGETGQNDYEVWTHVAEDNSHYPYPCFGPEPPAIRKPSYRPILVPRVWDHISERWPTSTPFKQCAKVAEEGGEVVGAAIKHDEGRRSRQDVLDELADTIIAAVGAIQALHADPADTVFTRWQEVRTR